MIFGCCCCRCFCFFGCFCFSCVAWLCIHAALRARFLVHALTVQVQNSPLKRTLGMYLCSFVHNNDLVTRSNENVKLSCRPAVKSSTYGVGINIVQRCTKRCTLAQCTVRPSLCDTRRLQPVSCYLLLFEKRLSEVLVPLGR